MTSIVLATLNARYIHAAFGLRCLLANMGEMQSNTQLLEFTINDNTIDILAAIAEQRPKIVGLGVYIWNVEQTFKLVSDLKRVMPEVVIVLGGPEVSYETSEQPIVLAADYVIAGEADLEFAKLCRNILDGHSPAVRLIQAPLPLMDQLQLPYELYHADDIANRVLYVEVSRGCPFTCEFCLSSLDIPVRLLNLEKFLAAMQCLFDRGARQFKFVDRTFNLNLRVSRAILQFFLDRYEPGLFLHFEMIPDRLPNALRELISRFPEGVLQFEIGVQSFNDEVGELISRRQDNSKLEENFRYLRAETGVHIHADLIVGLPGETLQSFADGFDRLFALRPQEIQVGMLKRLRGTPITRHDEPWKMVYSPHPPYEILANRLLDFEQIQRLRRFARYWDLIGNSGNFTNTLPLICAADCSAFEQIDLLSDWLYQRDRKMHGIALERLFHGVFDYLCNQRGLEKELVAKAIWQDYSSGGKRKLPAFLKAFDLKAFARLDSTSSIVPARQQRHLAQ